MKIEVWSDFVCPFCYIGKRRLEKALDQFPHKDEVKVEFKSFELDPNAPLYYGKSIHEALAAKYGMSIEQSKQNSAQIAQQAATDGLTFHFDEMKPTNTFDAHRLAKLAKAKGKTKEMETCLFAAVFTEGKDVGDHETLADLAEAAGLDRQEALQVLNNKQEYADEVRVDERMAQQYGISGVPYFIINQKYAISGAQPLETFNSALQKVWEEENAKPQFQTLSTDGAFCADGSCEVPEKEN